MSATLEEAHALIATTLDKQNLILATLSSPLLSEFPQKISIRSLAVKNDIHYQWTEQRQQQAFHRNLSKIECQILFQEQLKNYKQTFLFTDSADYQILINKKLQVTILKKPPSKSASSLPLTHNRAKEYLLEENTPISFLIELDVMNSQGKVFAQKRDKFRQINRFLEMVDDVLPNINKTHPLRIVDFGCGKSYLTFALYYYLRIVKNLKVSMVGLDLKSDVIKKCQALAKKLGYDDLSFMIGDINEHEESEHVDLVVSLHACDTASDAALEKAIHWQADVILCVPCCQHELFNQVSNSTLEPLLKHGIFKERFAALATDAARAQLLEVAGYRVQVLEFIDVEHTPKNLLIRAVRQTKKGDSQAAWQAYKNFKNFLKINPSLERRLKYE